MGWGWSIWVPAGSSLGEAPEASDGGVWTQRTPSSPPPQGPQAPLGRVSGGCSHRLGREQTLIRPLSVGRAGPRGAWGGPSEAPAPGGPHSSVSPNRSGLLSLCLCASPLGLLRSPRPGVQPALPQVTSSGSCHSHTCREQVGDLLWGRRSAHSHADWLCLGSSQAPGGGPDVAPGSDGEPPPPAVPRLPRPPVTCVPPHTSAHFTSWTQSRF